MLNQTLFSVLRTSSFRGPTLAADQAGSRRFAYENIKIHKLKYKSAAKERRKALVRAR